MKNNTIKDITQIALVAAIYAVLTVAIAPLSYGAIQMRISECLVLLCFYKKKYGIGLIIGCAIANIFSPYPLDIVFGTLSTVVAVLGIVYLSKNLEIATIFPTLSCLIVSAEISIVDQLPFFLTTFEVLIGEAIVINLIAYPLFKALEKNKSFDIILKGERKISDKNRLPLDNVSISLSVILILFFFTLPVFNNDTNTLYNLTKTSNNLWALTLLILPIIYLISSNIFKKMAKKIINTLIISSIIIILIVAVIYSKLPLNIPMFIYYIMICLFSEIYSILQKEKID